MTQEDKDLLLKDLCARLPYGIKCKVKYTVNNETTYGEDVEKECIDIIKRINFDTYSVYTEWLGYESDIEDIKPYLRSQSSITEEEREEYCNTEYIYLSDWFNEHHFDYRELIERGLAIAVTEENNPYENNN